MDFDKVKQRLILIKDEIVEYVFGSRRKTIVEEKEEMLQLKEEYLERIKEVRCDELASDRFKNIQNFVLEYRKRANIKLELELFKLVGDYDIEKDYIYKDIEDVETCKLKRYNDLKKFISSLTPEQIDSNVYLKTVVTFMEVSLGDCKLITERLNDMVCNMEEDDKNQMVRVDIPVPEERVAIMPSYVDTQKGIPYYRPWVYKIDYVNVLDEEDMPIYKEYNKYVYRVSKLIEDIYCLQMSNLCSLYPKDIKYSSLLIYNDGLHHRFITIYYVKKYQNDIVDMNYDDLEKIIEQKMREITSSEQNVKDEKLPLVLKR